MDYSIAVIVPGRLTARTAERTIRRLGYDYPVYAASTRDAVDIARTLLPKGLRIVISNGLTAECLAAELAVSVIVLPFSGLNTLNIVQRAVAISDKIVHIGTRQLYYYMQRSLAFLGLKPDTIHYCELSLGMVPLDRAREMLDLGYEVLIGGYTVADLANEAGRTGIEYDVEDLIIEASLDNARKALSYLNSQDEHSELDRAILHSTTDGIIALDRERHIFQINPAAAMVFRQPQDELIGRTLESAVSDSGLIAVDQLQSSLDEDIQNLTPVFLKELPVSVGGKDIGTVVSIKKVSEIQEMDYEAQKRLVLKGLVAKNHFKDIIGDCPAMQLAKRRAHLYAKSDGTVLIYGETGTGKELFAQSIHNASDRRYGPFVAINCAALPENLIESELFGYVKGAFTGAKREGKQGLFEIANKGTIFLDEISELPLAVQSKLLRILQDGELIRVGGDQIVRVDVRVICSSNKDLLKLAADGRFKDDLYYRLCVLELDIPPLRERPEDIEPLALNLMFQAAEKNRKPVSGIRPEVLQVLRGMQFKGNVRELANIIERMVILCSGSELDPETLMMCDIRELKDVPQDAGLPQDAGAPQGGETLPGRDVQRAAAPQTAGEAPAAGGTEADIPNAAAHLKAAQRGVIVDALNRCGGNKTAAARLLGINPSTLWRRMKALEMQ